MRKVWIGLPVVAALLLQTILNTGYAAQVKIRVLDAGTNKPLAKAAVCLGTQADSRQFGARRTPENGTVAFPDIPDSPLRLTVSKRSYLGQRALKPAALYDRLFIVHLSKGGQGPRCMHPRKSAPTAQSAVSGLSSGIDKLHINRFQIDHGDPVTTKRKVTLELSTTGNPTQYRISENEKFKGSDWQSYQGSPTYRLSKGHGRKTLYLQVRRYDESHGAELTSLSDTVSDSITFITP